MCLWSRMEIDMRCCVFPVWRCRDNLARTQILWAERSAKLKRQRQAALDDLASEAKHWITPENRDQMITPELFELHPTTTGIVTHASEYWRHEVFVPSMQRLLSPHFMEKMQTMPTEESDIRREGQVDVQKRAVVEMFLNGIITSPEDRKNFRSLVKRTTLEFEAGGAFDELEEEMSEDAEHDAYEASSKGVRVDEDDDVDDLEGEDDDVELESADNLDGLDLSNLTEEEFEKTVMKMMKSREFMEELSELSMAYGESQEQGEDEKFEKLLSEKDDSDDDEDDDEDDDDDDDEDSRKKPSQVPTKNQRR